MSAEYLIALETALAEAGELYSVAVSLLPLREEAEEKLLPRLEGIGAELRRSARGSGLTPTDIERVAAELAALRDDWLRRFDELRSSRLYRETLDARRRDDGAALARLLPRLLADLTFEEDPPPLFAPFSPVAGRRHGGSPPFLSPEECAARIAAVYDEGLRAATGEAWWDSDLPGIDLSADAGLLDTPIALRFDPADLPAAVFRWETTNSFRVYADRVRGRFEVVLQPHSDDEWWAAADPPWETYRDRLRELLRVRAIPSSVTAPAREAKGRSV